MADTITLEKDPVPDYLGTRTSDYRIKDSHGNMTRIGSPFVICAKGGIVTFTPEQKEQGKHEVFDRLWEATPLLQQLQFAWQRAKDMPAKIELKSESPLQTMCLSRPASTPGKPHHDGRRFHG